MMCPAVGSRRQVLSKSCLLRCSGAAGTYALQDAANELARAYPQNVVALDLRGSMQEASGTIAPPFPNTVGMASVPCGGCLVLTCAPYFLQWW
jgi:hypothetical protein